MSLRHLLLPLALLGAATPACTRDGGPTPAAAAATLPAAPRPLPDALKARRPEKGEFFGLYLMGKKVGWLFTHLTAAEGKVTYVEELHFKANVGQRVSNRFIKKTHLYEAKPAGKLLSFIVEQKGDGGDQTLEGTSTPTGLRVLRKRPGQANETLTLKPARETVDDADQVRVAILRNQTVEGVLIHDQDLEQYRVVTTVAGTEKRTVGGVTFTVTRTTTIDEKEKISTDTWTDEQGRVLEMNQGGTMRVLAEPEEQAKKLEVVEIFGLTRVVLPRPPPEAAERIPGQLTLTLTGLPAQFRLASPRQQFEALDGERVRVTVKAFPPQKRLPRPLLDPDDGKNLKSTIVVESEHPDIIQQARAIAGDEKDAWTAAKKVARWVNVNVQKDYGASSDHATGVLKLMKGDCTEHSLLTEALLRALGIPARRVDGLVYVMNEDKVPAYYWHEWVEAWVGEWTQLDPTFGQDVADARHLGVGQEASAEITPLISTMKVLAVE